VDSAEDLDPNWFDGVQSVGVTSGASVPDDLAQGVIKWLTSRGWPEAKELVVVKESLHFALPASVR